MINLRTGIQPYFFIGRVENKDDPTNNSRIKVRCIGVHPEFPNIATNSKEELNYVEDIDLPWAHCINGTYGAMNAVPDEGDWVFGFFADGRDCQHPFVLGTLPGMNTEEYGPPPPPPSPRDDVDVNDNRPNNTPRNEPSGEDVLTNAEVDEILSGEEPERARASAEDYLGRPLSDEEWDNLVAATVAEAMPNSPQEQAYVMAVILNRVRSSAYPDDVISVLNQRNQFQAVTGTRNDPGPSNNFVNPARSQVASSIAGVNDYLTDAPRDWLNFTSNITEAYGEGTDITFRDRVRNSPGAQIVGGTVFGTVR
jgi:hypothetical protein